MPQEQRISEPEGIFQDQLILPSHFTDVKTSSEMGMAGWHHRACPHTPCSGLQGHAALELNPHGVPNRQRAANIVVPWMPDSEMTLPVKLPKQSSPPLSLDCASVLSSTSADQKDLRALRFLSSVAEGQEKCQGNLSQRLISEHQNISYLISKQRKSLSSGIAVIPRVSPEGTQEGNKESLPSSGHQAAATPYGEPWGNSNMKTQDTGPRQLRSISEKWFQWAQTLSSSNE